MPGVVANQEEELDFYSTVDFASYVEEAIYGDCEEDKKEEDE